jgi:hypothetical protein
VGRCVLLLKSAYAGSAGRYLITNRLDVFLQIDHVGVEVFTKTLHPLLGRSADINFVESTAFLQRISRAAEQNGPGLQQLAERLDDVEPDIRSQFAGLTAEVHSRAATQQASGPASDDGRTARRTGGF